MELIMNSVEIATSCDSAVKNPQLVLSEEESPKKKYSHHLDVYVESSTEASADITSRASTNHVSEVNPALIAAEDSATAIGQSAEEAQLFYNRRTTLILRDTNAETKESDILQLLKSCPHLEAVENVQLTQKCLNNWYFSFQKEETAVAVAWWLKSQTLLGEPVSVRMKTEVPVNALPTIDYFVSPQNPIKPLKNKNLKNFNNNENNQYKKKNNRRKQNQSKKKAAPPQKLKPTPNIYNSEFPPLGDIADLDSKKLAKNN